MQRSSASFSFSTLVLLITVTLLLAACGGLPGGVGVSAVGVNNANTDNAASPTRESIDFSQLEAASLITPTVIFESTDGTYIIGASTVEVFDQGTDNPPPTRFPEIGEENKWVMITSSLFNNSTTPISVESPHLTLVTVDNQRIAPFEDTTLVTPSLIGETVEADYSPYAFVLFVVPDAAELFTLEWCPGGTCEQPLQAVLIFTDIIE